MHKLSVAAIFLGSVIVAGCATTGTNGVVSMGPDTYMIGGLGGFTDYSGSAVKSRFISKAKEYCAKTGKFAEIINSTGKDSAPYQYASAEVQFRCVSDTNQKAGN